MDEQPLLEEPFGIQVEAIPAQLADELDLDSIRVFFSYYVGDEYWGYDGENGWRGRIPEAQTACELPRCGNSLVWRSAYSRGFERSILPAQSETRKGMGTVVQYHVWAEYKDAMGVSHVHEVQFSDGWKNPSWYYPIDYNEENGGYANESRFCPYTILQRISPKRAWINCINIYDVDSSAYYTNQFIELAVPAGIDMTDWHIRFRENGNPEYAVELATLGHKDVAAWKYPENYNGYGFLTLQSPSTTFARGDSADGTWNSFSLSDGSIPGGTFKYNGCYALELIRPNGIIEHQVVFGGLSLWEDYDPGVLRDELTQQGIPKVGANWVLAGTDKTDGTIGVMANHGVNDSDWETDLLHTAGTHNRRRDGVTQYIDYDWFLSLPSHSTWE